MDGGSQRDTIPGSPPGNTIECDHCGGDAFVGDELLIGVSLKCATCDHPGQVDFDATGQLAWFLGNGRCNDSKCADCYPSSTERIQAIVDGAALSMSAFDPAVFEIPDVRTLLEHSRQIALETDLSHLAALRRLCEELDARLVNARKLLARSRLSSEETITVALARCRPVPRLTAIVEQPQQP